MVFLGRTDKWAGQDPAIFPSCRSSHWGRERSNCEGKYQKSLLSDKQSAEISRQLIKLMETERLYLAPSLIRKNFT